MNIITLLNQVTDIIITPFANFGPVIGLSIISFISAVVLLYLFKVLSNQEKIKFHKNKIFGHFLIRIFSVVQYIQVIKFVFQKNIFTKMKKKYFYMTDASLTHIIKNH